MFSKLFSINGAIGLLMFMIVYAVGFGVGQYNKKEPNDFLDFAVNQCTVIVTDSRTVQSPECRNVGKTACAYKVNETSLLSTVLTSCTKRTTKKLYIGEQRL